jgi:hypothetical protein
MFKGVAWEQISGLVQRGLMFGAGVVVAKGWVSEAGATQIVGGLLAIIGTVWSVKVNTTTALTESVKNLDGVKGIVTDNTPAGRALADSIPGTDVAAAGSHDAKSLAATTGDRV